MKQETNPFPKTKLQWLWENMKGCRGIYFVGMAGTVVYNILQLTVPYFSGKIVDLFLTGENARENLSTHRDLFTSSSLRWCSSRSFAVSSSTASA